MWLKKFIYWPKVTFVCRKWPIQVIPEACHPAFVVLFNHLYNADLYPQSPGDHLHSSREIIRTPASSILPISMASLLSFHLKYWYPLFLLVHSVCLFLHLYVDASYWLFNIDMCGVLSILNELLSTPWL